MERSAHDNANQQGIPSVKNDNLPGVSAANPFVYGEGNVPGEWSVEELFCMDFENALIGAEAVVILDPMSFAWEAYKDIIVGKVVYFVQPRNLPAAMVTSVFKDILTKLTIFDRIVTWDADLFESLEHLCVAECQRIHLRPDNTPYAWSIADYEARNSRSDALADPGNTQDLRRYWIERGARYSSVQPERAVCSIRHSLGQNKLMHSEQMYCLKPVLKRLEPDREWSVIEFGCGAGRILSELNRFRANLTGVDISADLLEVCRRNIPSADCIQSSLGELQGLPEESFDLAVFVTVLHHLDAAEKLVALRNAFKTVRHGGHLLLLEDHVASTQPSNAITRPLRTGDFFQLMTEATSAGVTLEDFQTVQYSHVPEIRTCLSVFRKL